MIAARTGARGSSATPWPPPGISSVRAPAVTPASARDVFHHPFAYAAARGIDTRSGAAEALAVAA